MASPEVHHLFHHPIADHSFSSDRQTLAVAKDTVVDLYKRSAGKLTHVDELKGHDKTVTGVDIAPTTGRIVTCSQGKRRVVLIDEPLAIMADMDSTRSKCICMGTLA